MTVGSPIGLLLAITFAIAAVPLPQSTGSDSLETITAVNGSAIIGQSYSDSTESITSVSGSAVSAQSNTDSTESITTTNGSPASATSDSLEGM